MQERSSSGKHGHLSTRPEKDAESRQLASVAASFAVSIVNDKENIDPSRLVADRKSMIVHDDAEATPIIKHGCSSLGLREPLGRPTNEGDDSDFNPQDKCLEIRSTPDRGLAVFASRKIKAGTLILSERSLITLCKEEEDDHAAIEREFSNLSRSNQKIYLKLFDAEKSRMSRVASIYYSNCYNLDSLTPDGRGGSALGNMASRLNHSCIANAQFSYDFDRKQLMFYAIRDIPRGREVCSNYEKNVFEAAIKRMQKLRMYYAFDCRCEACEGVQKNEFWGRSDERRKAMLYAFKQVQTCDKAFLNQQAENIRSNQELKDKVIDEAISALTRLEALLLKECLTGIVLANTCRSLSKWCERKQRLVEAAKWKEKELQSCEMGLGSHAYRTREAAKKLAELGNQLPI
ncbi:hypothetical protein LTR84_011672 [Exophiala bonariae]|uniref:SET domain-containing protein n=1 Tax=Exophiala bonariae TaxID=1690606 RepID=A0AAV9NH26_9EURO|nr:hypothetical protein LTR84_011672 [Exophiala bonariae]